MNVLRSGTGGDVVGIIVGSPVVCVAARRHPPRASGGARSRAAKDWPARRGVVARAYNLKGLGRPPRVVRTADIGYLLSRQLDLFQLSVFSGIIALILTTRGGTCLSLYLCSCVASSFYVLWLSTNETATRRKIQLDALPVAILLVPQDRCADGRTADLLFSRGLSARLPFGQNANNCLWSSAH